MKILMVSSEVFPFAKVGGLGDVIPHLSVALSRMGHEVKIFMPRYYEIDRVLLDKHPAPLSFQLGDEEIWAAVYTQTIAGSSVDVYFLEHEGLFGRDGVYGDRKTQDYPDNLRRFAALSKGAFSLCRLIQWYPDIIHSHDWASGLVQTYLKSHEEKGCFIETAGVFSIHNIGYQGVFDTDKLGEIGFGEEDFHGLGLEYHDKISTLKTALVNADAITTVSPNYAREILEPGLGFGLDGVLRERKDRLFGVLNGMDYELWDPARDQQLPYPYNENSLENKGLNKNYIQQESHLEITTRPPMIGMVSRLVGQKGFELLLGENGNGLRRICNELDLQLIILGTGEDWIEDGIRTIAGECDNLRAYIRYNEKMSHIIQAASDFFLMPSLYEPCGLTQMYALRYGALPIVSPTGGLQDTVRDFGSSADGTGIIIDEGMTADDLFRALERAVDLWTNRHSQYQEIQKRGMAERFGWPEAAGEYEKIYNFALESRREYLESQFD